MTAGSVARDWLASLNPAQREAAEHVHGPIMVLAGAGSGKTRVLTVRIARLIEEHGVPIERLFAVTFTNKAAHEMKERIGAMLGRDPVGLWIGTFHSLSARLLRRDAERIGFSRAFTIFDEDDRLSLVKRLMDARNHSTKLFPPRAVVSIISSAKNKMQSAESLAAAGRNDALVQVSADIMGAMAGALRSQNAMDFDDLMLHPLALFRDHPDRLALWRERFQFILVDEFQDTNRAQYELVKLLGGHGNIFAVGDDDQSIYGWRGAEVRNMKAFQADFDPVRLVRLEENYRSTHVVLDTANAVIAENRSRLGKTLRTRRQGGERVTLLASADERDEAEWLTQELAKRVRSGDWVYPDMAILYRTNSQSRAFEEAFRRAGIPYRLIGAISFYDRREVKDLLAYLRLVANPADDEAFLRAIAVPRRGIGDASLAILRESATQWQKPLLETASVADRIQGLRPNLREAFRGFGRLIADLAVMARDLQPGLILEELVRRLNYEQLLAEEGIEGADRWENVRELIAAAASWSEVLEDGEGTPLERFLTEAALLSGQDKEAGTDRGVTLMTVHTAKGLEWPVVVVAGLEDGLFPLARAMDAEDTLEEERRLFYVAITRAKDKVYLSWARTRRRGGEIRPGMASRFLRSLPPPLVEEKQTGSMWTPQPTSYGRRDWRGGGARGSGRVWEESQAFVPSSRPPAEEASQAAPRFVKGERVRHRRFGSGVIEGLIGAGKDLKVSVKFDDEAVGSKQLLVAYAGLEREWEEGA
jgi:DNA helicase-2/ATP-dependent DNA helicase PcrA